MIAPIALYYGLRAAGVGIYLALIGGALPPALTATGKLIKDRRLDGLAMLVLGMLVASTLLSLITGNPRFLLARDGWMTGVWSVLFFGSLIARRPVTFLFAQPLLEGRSVWDPEARRWSTPVAASWDELWERTPRFRHVWRVCTVVWGAALLVDAVTRVVMAYTLPVKVVPALGGALWPVTFLILQVITNVYFARSGLWLILLGKGDGPSRVNGSGEQTPLAHPGPAELQPQT